MIEIQEEDTMIRLFAFWLLAAVSTLAFAQPAPQ